MTEVEYTEKALDHLENLDPQVADRVMNKVDETTEWTEHRRRTPFRRVSLGGKIVNHVDNPADVDAIIADSNAGGQGQTNEDEEGSTSSSPGWVDIAGISVGRILTPRECAAFGCSGRDLNRT